MISYGKHSIQADDIEEVSKVLKSDWLTQGPYIEKFEKDLNSFFGAKYSSAVCNGTAALHLVALSLNLSKNDIVITSPITFFFFVYCIEYVGATPDFVDIDSSSYTIDVQKLEQRILSHRKKGKVVKAIIGVDYAGHPCDWKNIKKVADKYDIVLINDNCHAMGASLNGDYKYALKYADFVTQSFHPVKHITTGEGGAVITNQKKYDDKIKLLRSHGMEKKNNHRERSYGPWYYEMHDLGYNYRITDIQCALGVSQLKKINNFIKKRKKIASIYDDQLRFLDNVKTPSIKENTSHAYHLYPLKIDFKKNGKNKIDFFDYLIRNNIFLQVHYIPVHLQPFYRKKYGFKIGDYPISENFYENEISLPIYPLLSFKDQKYVISKIKEFLI